MFVMIVLGRYGYISIVDGVKKTLVSTQSSVCVCVCVCVCV